MNANDDIAFEILLIKDKIIKAYPLSYGRPSGSQTQASSYKNC